MKIFGIVLAVVLSLIVVVLTFRTVLYNTYEVHRHNMNGAAGNRVFLYEDGHQEMVLDVDDKVVEDCANMASYNYRDARKEPFGHLLLDDVPWLVLGNCPEDPTTVTQRLKAYMLDLADGTKRTFNVYAGGSFDRKDVKAAEIYVRLYPGDGYLLVKEYKVSTLLSSRQDIEGQIKEIKELVSKAGYAKERFGCEEFVAVEERMYKDGGVIMGEYHLLTKEKNVRKMVEGCFEKIVNKDVVMKTEEENISMFFDSGDDFVVVSDNSLGVYKKNSLSAVLWKNGARSYEVVFTFERKDAPFKSVFEYFGEDVASPEKSKEEIERWKKS